MIHKLGNTALGATHKILMGRNIRKRTLGDVRPAKIQIRLRICAV